MATVPDPYELVAAALECQVVDLLPEAELGKHAKWDSFSHVEIMLALEESYGIDITEDTITRFSRLSEIVDAYGELTQGE